MRFINALTNATLASIESHYVDAYGDHAFIVVATNIPCKFNDVPTLVYSQAGVAELSKATAWVNTTATVDEGYKVVYGGDTFEIMEVTEMYGVDGNMTHKKVLLR
jgi:hypothetical protein